MRPFFRRQSARRLASCFQTTPGSGTRWFAFFSAPSMTCVPAALSTAAVKGLAASAGSGLLVSEGEDEEDGLR